MKGVEVLRLWPNNLNNSKISYALERGGRSSDWFNDNFPFSHNRSNYLLPFYYSYLYRFFQ
jgi:hypothetical protein